MTLSKWTPDLINQIRDKFLNGHEIKLIARSINKTPTAVNKALSRYGIRKDSNINLQRSLAIKKQTQHIRPANKNRANTWIKRMLTTDIDHWVSFLDVKEFLSSQNVNVALIKNGKNLADQEFLIKGKICSAMQVVLAANKIRADLNLSTFFVKNLTW